MTTQHSIMQTSQAPGQGPDTTTSSTEPTRAPCVHTTKEDSKTTCEDPSDGSSRAQSTNEEGKGSTGLPDTGDMQKIYSDIVAELNQYRPDQPFFRWDGGDIAVSVQEPSRCVNLKYEASRGYPHCLQNAPSHHGAPRAALQLEDSYCISSTQSPGGSRPSYDGFVAPTVLPHPDTVGSSVHATKSDLGPVLASEAFHPALSRISEKGCCDPPTLSPGGSQPSCVGFGGPTTHTHPDLAESSVRTTEFDPNEGLASEAFHHASPQFPQQPDMGDQRSLPLPDLFQPPEDACLDATVVTQPVIPVTDVSTTCGDIAGGNSEEMVYPGCNSEGTVYPALPESQETKELQGGATSVGKMAEINGYGIFADTSSDSEPAASEDDFFWVSATDWSTQKQDAMLGMMNELMDVLPFMEIGYRLQEGELLDHKMLADDKFIEFGVATYKACDFEDMGMKQIEFPLDVQGAALCIKQCWAVIYGDKFQRVDILHRRPLLHPGGAREIEDEDLQLIMDEVQDLFEKVPGSPWRPEQIHKKAKVVIPEPSPLDPSPPCSPPSEAPSLPNSPCPADEPETGDLPACTQADSVEKLIDLQVRDGSSAERPLLVDDRSKVKQVKDILSKVEDWLALEELSDRQLDQLRIITARVYSVAFSRMNQRQKRREHLRGTRGKAGSSQGAISAFRKLRKELEALMEPLTSDAAPQIESPPTRKQPDGGEDAELECKVSSGKIVLNTSELPEQDTVGCAGILEPISQTSGLADSCAFPSSPSALLPAMDKDLPESPGACSDSDDKVASNDINVAAADPDFLQVGLVHGSHKNVPIGSSPNVMENPDASTAPSLSDSKDDALAGPTGSDAGSHAENPACVPQSLTEPEVVKQKLHVLVIAADHNGVMNVLCADPEVESEEPLNRNGLFFPWREAAQRASPEELFEAYSKQLMGTYNISMEVALRKAANSTPYEVEQGDGTIWLVRGAVARLGPSGELGATARLAIPGVKGKPPPVSLVEVPLTDAVIAIEQGQHRVISKAFRCALLGDRSVSADFVSPLLGNGPLGEITLQSTAEASDRVFRFVRDFYVMQNPAQEGTAELVACYGQQAVSKLLKHCLESMQNGHMDDQTRLWLKELFTRTPKFVETFGNTPVADLDLEHGQGLKGGHCMYLIDHEIQPGLHEKRRMDISSAASSSLIRALREPARTHQALPHDQIPYPETERLDNPVSAWWVVLMLLERFPSLIPALRSGAAQASQEGCASGGLPSQLSPAVVHQAFLTGYKLSPPPNIQFPPRRLNRLQMQSANLCASCGSQHAQHCAECSGTQCLECYSTTCDCNEPDWCYAGLEICVTCRGDYCASKDCAYRPSCQCPNSSSEVNSSGGPLQLAKEPFPDETRQLQAPTSPMQASPADEEPITPNHALNLGRDGLSSESSQTAAVQEEQWKRVFMEYGGLSDAQASAVSAEAHAEHSSRTPNATSFGWWLPPMPPNPTEAFILQALAVVTALRAVQSDPDKRQAVTGQQRALYHGTGPLQGAARATRGEPSLLSANVGPAARLLSNSHMRSPMHPIAQAMLDSSDSSDQYEQPAAGHPNLSPHQQASTRSDDGSDWLSPHGQVRLAAGSPAGIFDPAVRQSELSRMRSRISQSANDELDQYQTLGGSSQEPMTPPCTESLPPTVTSDSNLMSRSI